MNKTGIRVVSIFLISCFIAGNAFTGVILLKSGKTIEGEIIEETEEYIKVNFHGVAITYYFDDIESIDGRRIYIPKAYTNSASFRKTPEDIFRQISPAVVYITTETIGGESYLGSGFIVDSAGVIITNYHVLQAANKANVQLKDGKVYPVSGVLYYDVQEDICILKIDASGLPVITLGDSSALDIGETVYCIGNPLGLEYSFSNGILAGKRDFQDLQYLQFTAPVSPGNSGGPLINTQGEAVGVVTFLAEGGQNLNFALSIEKVKPNIKQSGQISFEEFTGQVTKADYYFLEGNKFLLQGDSNQAIDCYQQVLNINPACPEAYTNMGIVYYNLGDYQKAAAYYQNALNMDPNNSKAYNNLGNVFHMLGDYQKAMTYYQQALNMDSNNAQAYYNLGLLYDGTGDYQKAIVYYQNALNIDPNMVSAYNNLGFLYGKLGNYQEEIIYCQKALYINPKEAPAYYNLGFAYYNLGNYPQARQSYLRAKELFQEQGDSQAAQTVEQLLSEIPAGLNLENKP